MSSLQSIDRRVGVGSQVYDAIEKAIVSLELKPGQLLSEKELALQLGVSRTPVREALVGLRAVGLVESYPQVGTVVAKIDVRQVYEAQFIREALESACVRRAASAPDSQALEELAEILKLQRRCVKDHDHEAFYLLDERLHQMLAQMSGYPRVWDTTRNSKIYLDRVRKLSLPMPSLLSQLVRQHVQIANKIRAGDVTGADTAIRTHVREVLRVVEPLTREFPDYFVTGEAGTRPDEGGHAG